MKSYHAILAAFLAAWPASGGLVVDGVLVDPKCGDATSTASDSPSCGCGTNLYPVFRFDLGEHWTDFEIKATTNGYAVEGNSGSNLVYYYKSWTAIQHERNPDTNAWAYYTDDYASDPRVWIRKGLTNSIADQLANTGSVVCAVYFFPSRDCECGWMRRDNTNLVWSWMRVSDGEYEKRLDGTRTRWRPIRPDSWEAGRTAP